MLILASASPRRKELISRILKIPFSVIETDIDETCETSDPEAFVRELSRKKAHAAPCCGTDTVIGADTVVFHRGKILGKPRSEAEGASMIRALSGDTHEVYTGLTVKKGAHIDTRCEKTRVTFRVLCEREVLNYIKTGEYMDKAGAYGIQEYGALLVRKIDGDFYNVVGLPVCLLYDMLRAAGISLPV